MKQKENIMSIDYVVPRLCYEILNISLEDIAERLGLTLGMVQNIAERQRWTPWYPEELEQQSISLVDELELDDHEDPFTIKVDQFLDSTKKRLSVFNMAKELALVEQYAALEVSLIQKARTAIENIDPTDIRSLKDATTIYRDLAKNMASAVGAVSFAQDDNGLPTVVIRDLSGS